MPCDKKESGPEMGHKTRIMFDPPEGWRYGFPCEVSKNVTTQEIRDLLVRHKYPKSQIEFAMAWARYYEVKE